MQYILNGIAVDRATFLARERALGFLPICAPDDPERETLLATGGWGLGPEEQGRVEYTAEERAALRFDLSSLDSGGCPCYGESTGGCVCEPTERVLRVVAGGRRAMPPLSHPQRRGCLQEIAGVEGFRWEDYSTSADRDLARGVLDAWVSFCRDTGLL